MEELESTQQNESPEVAETTEAVESAERAEEQAVEEATHDPGARVEETQTFEQAEAVEEALVQAVEAAPEQEASPLEEEAPPAESSPDGDDLPEGTGILEDSGEVEIAEPPDATPGTQPESAAKPDEPESQAQDPLTGKGYGQQTQEPSEGSEPEEPVMSDASSGEMEAQVQVEGLTTDEAVGQASGDAEVDPGLIDGNEPVYQMEDQEPDPSGAIGEGVSEPQGNTSPIDPQRIDDAQLPEELIGPLGFDMGGGTKKPGSPPGSSSGPPVSGPGGGSKGNKDWPDNTIPGDSILGRQLYLKSQKSSSGTVMDEDGSGYWAMDKNGDWHYQVIDGEEAPAEKPPQGDPIDGDQPMPYTGSTGGGGDPDPEEPVGGLDREAGAFFPVYGKGGGGDSSGGTPGDKDGEDDSGKFLADGELGDGGLLDPGDLDYNEADQANTEIDKKLRDDLIE